PSDVKTFAFDYSYWSHDGFEERPDGVLEPQSASSNYASQKRVFGDLGQGVLNNAFLGYNCSLFAYGQTGAGKSYSMVGYGSNRFIHVAIGIVPITCDELFKTIAENSSNSAQRYEVTFSMLEIYNENVRDLLGDASAKSGLPIRQHPSQGFYVHGLKRVPVGSYREIEQRMEQGTASRTVAATNMNATSSRAHTVVTIVFDQIAGGGGKETKKSSVMNLVDLAGSERADSTGATGDRLKEGANINKSLSALGNVISALADLSTGKKKVMVPYRDSVLTKLLQNALGGNSKTVMIAALSPADINYDETLSTLRYADRAKKIKNQAVVNENPMDKLLRELQMENERLKKVLDSGDLSSAGFPQQQQQTGMSKEDVEKMRKELEEEIRAQLMSNSELMQQSSSDNWEAKSPAMTRIKWSLCDSMPLLADAECESSSGNRLLDMRKVSYNVAVVEGSVIIGAASPRKFLKGLVTKSWKAFRIREPSSKRSWMRKLKVLSHIRIGLRAVKVQCGGEFPHFPLELPARCSLLIYKMQRNQLRELRPRWQSSVSSQLSAADARADLAPVSEAADKKSQIPHLLNLNEDPMLSGVVVHFLESAEILIGRSEEELQPQIRLMGLSISKRHAVIARLTDTEFEIRPAIQGAKTLVNGLPLTGPMELTHKDRIVFGSNHVYVFINPKNRSCNAGLPKRINWEFVQKEIANVKGFATGSAEQAVVQEQILELIPMVTEVNAISDELNKYRSFEVILLPVTRPDGTKGSRCAVQMQDLLSDLEWRWERGKFMNRRFLMLELYQRFQAGDASVHSVAKDADPFWEPPEEVTVGTATLFLQSLAYCLDFEDRLPIVDHRGVVEGHVTAGLTPCDSDGRPLGEDEFVEEPEDLLGRPLRFNVRIESAELLRQRHARGACRVTFALLSRSATTQTLADTAAPKFAFSEKFSLASVQPQHLKLLTQGSVTL
uniref:Kinesin-like protein n=1 Tax=Macrostomum lignano TaxID=282301 RepID=A0A1I8HLB6_9PLAT